MGDCKTSRVRPGNASTPRNAYHPTANSAITQQEMQRTPMAAVRSQMNALMVTPNDRTERCGRPSASDLGPEVARPHSLQ
jgi:hypothetical protein